MLSLQTRDGWTTAAATIQVGVHVDTWNATTIAPSAVDALQALTAWANDPARPWWGLALFDWGWDRQPTTGGAVLIVRNSGGVWSWTPNATALALLGIAAAVGVLEVTGTTAAVGTWAPGPTGQLALKLGVLWLRSSGQASAVGAVRSGVPGLAPWVARCTPVTRAQDAARLTAILAVAAHPRRAWLRVSNVARSSEFMVPPDVAGWRLVALGEVTRSRQGTALWRHELAVAGEAV